MRWIRTIRISIGVLMMFVLTSATAFALFAKVRQHTAIVDTTAKQTGWRFDVPSLFLLAIVLTALAIGAWKSHSPVQIMLQIALACFGCLALIWIGEAQYERALRYWFQGSFAISVVLPLMGRRLVKSTLPRGPKRDWWKKTFEAIFFSFINLMLVSLGGIFQAFLIALGPQFLAAAGARL
jgi:hypothetical protein